LTVLLIERQYRHFRLCAFPFFPRNSERWGLTRGYPRAKSVLLAAPNSEAIVDSTVAVYPSHTDRLWRGWCVVKAHTHVTNNRWPSTLYWRNTRHRFSRGSRSCTFFEVDKTCVDILACSQDFSKICRRAKIWSAVLQPGRKPH